MEALGMVEYAPPAVGGPLYWNYDLCPVCLMFGRKEGLEYAAYSRKPDHVKGVPDGGSALYPAMGER